MGKFLGENFDDFVRDQINTRQKKLGITEYDNELITYTTSKDSWIRLASGVDVSQEKLAELEISPLGKFPKGNSLAESYVLFGGANNVAKSSKPKGGLIDTYTDSILANASYGFDSTAEYGLTPLPGVTSFNIKPKKKIKVAKKEPKQEEFKPKKTNQDNEAPVIEIAEAITVDSQAYTLKGKVKDKSQIYLTIDGRQVDVKKGKFKLDRFNINPDVIEEIKIVAIDQWNNRTEKTIKVTIDLQSTDIAKVYEQLKPNNIKVKTDKNKIAPEDEITKINGGKIEGKLSDILKDCKDEVTFTIKKKFSEKSISLAIGNHYELLEFMKMDEAKEEQLTFRKVWSS